MPTKINPEIVIDEEAVVIAENTGDEMMNSTFFNYTKKALSFVPDLIFGQFVKVNQDDFNAVLKHKQGGQHCDKESIYYAIIKGDLDDVISKLNTDERLQSNVIDKYRDAVGATIVHVAYLYCQYTIARYFVRTYPQLALLSYADTMTDGTPLPEGLLMPYAGENALHMTVIRRNHVETRWLLDFYRDHKDSIPGGLARLLTSNVNGGFFRKGGRFHFGDYPLHFAVCANDKDIFDLVLTYYNLVSNEKDSQGKEIQLGENTLFSTDDESNNMLHFCVMYHLKDMYEHVHDAAVGEITKTLKIKYAEAKLRNHSAIKLSYYKDPIPIPQSDKNLKRWLHKQTKKILNEKLLFALNKDHHSPLTLAAAVKNSLVEVETSDGDANSADSAKSRKRIMLEFFMNRLRTQQWTYGPVTSYSLKLEGLEFPLASWDHKNPEQKVYIDKFRGAVELLCLTDSQDCVTIPEIKMLIETKWNRCGFPNFVKSCYLNFTLTALITLLLCLINQSPTLHPTTSAEMAVCIIYPITAFTLLVMVLKEIPFVLKYNIHYFSRFRGAAKFSKLCRICITLSFISLCCCKLSNAVQGKGNKFDPLPGSSSYYNPQDFFGEKFSMALCILSSWSYVYYFFMGFDGTGPFVLTIYRIISRNIPYFLQFYFIILVGFACALSMLTNSGNPDVGYGFKHLILAIGTLIKLTVNAPVTNDVIDIHNVPFDLQWIYDILFTTYYISVGLMMLNLLIAIIGNTFGALIECNEALLLIEKYNIMCGMELCMSKSELAEFQGNYTTDVDQDGNQTNNSKFAKKLTAVGQAGAANATPVPSLKSPGNLEPSQAIQHYMEESIERHVVHRVLEYENVDAGWFEYDDSEKCADQVQEKVVLLIIDPQRDFNDAPNDAGSLAVCGANEDCKRIADMIRSNMENIHEIFVTLDSHYRTHIAHAVFWEDEQGAHPKPFDQITLDSLWKIELSHTSQAGKWRPRGYLKSLADTQNKRVWMELYEWCLYYVITLKKQNKYQCTIWPEHCLVGTKGHAVVPVVNDALQEWAASMNKTVTYVSKGQNYRTEMYSALRAEVEDPLDPSTAFNEELMGMFKMADKLIVCGEALSHCVKATLTDIIANMREVENLYLLTDGSSSVYGCDALGSDFKIVAKSQGVNLSTTLTVFQDIHNPPVAATAALKTA